MGAGTTMMKYIPFVGNFLFILASAGITGIDAYVYTLHAWQRVHISISHQNWRNQTIWQRSPRTDQHWGCDAPSVLYGMTLIYAIVVILIAIALIGGAIAFAYFKPDTDEIKKSSAERKEKLQQTDTASRL